MYKRALGIIVIVVIFFGATYLVYKLAAAQKPEERTTFYKLSDKERPRLGFDRSQADVGRLKLSDTSTTAFTLQNKGDKPLDIFNISSTCGCTFGQLEYRGQKSGRFSMHSNSNYILTLNPKEKAKLYVIYKPALMPVQGQVERAVVIRTNDPENPEMYFGVTAFVE